MSVVAAVNYSQRLERVPVDVYSFVVRPHPGLSRRDGPFVAEDDLHWHRGVELYYCRSGRGVYRFGEGREIDLAPGVLFIFDATCPHGARYDLHEPYWGYAVHIRENTYRILVGGSQDVAAIPRQDPLFFHTRLPKAGQAVAIEALHDIVSAMAGVDPERYLRTNAKLIELILLAWRGRLQETEDRSRRVLVRRIKEYIAAHLHEELSVQSIAQRMGYNRSYLSTIFREEIGVPLSDYIRRCRLESAADLLVETDLPLTEIGLSVGLGDLSQFSRSFRQAFAVSPSKYRKQFRK